MFVEVLLSLNKHTRKNILRKKQLTRILHVKKRKQLKKNIRNIRNIRKIRK